VQQPPRKVLLIVNALLFGGAEIQLAHLAKGLSEAGHDVTLCCVKETFVDTASIEEAGVKIVSLHAQNRHQRIAALPRMVRLARQAEIVQCTIWDASLWGRIAAILARRPVVVADHATDRSIHTSSTGASRASWVALHNRLLDPFTYATVACATSQREVLLGEGVAAGKIVHIPNGLPIKEMIAGADASPGRAALGLPEGVPLIMQVGVFRKEKNQIGALEAIAGIRASGTEVHLAFVGDGPTKPEVEQRARELGADWAHFLGFQSNVPPLLTLADILLQPSDADAMPLTVLEAMALGIPIVATAVGDVPAMLGDRAGICVPPRDREALERACVELLSDPGRGAAMGEAGKEIAAAADSEAMVASYERLFQAALHGQAPGSAIEEDQLNRGTPLPT
jgi:glycosyltransferase involved in cell wall biosynthesis